MPIFAIYTQVELIKKPAWLDHFRERYDKPYPYHVTLKQPCFIEEKDKESVKTSFKRFFEERKGNVHSILLVFTKLVMVREKQDGFTTIMIDTESRSAIEELQSELVASLGSYRAYVKAESEDWEKYFHPHITIARNLSDEHLAQAKNTLGLDFRCEGVIREVVLSIVAEDTPEEARKPENKTIYLLGTLRNG